MIVVLSSRSELVNVLVFVILSSRSELVNALVFVESVGVCKRGVCYFTLSAIACKLFSVCYTF